jgi:hypothetical protein
MLLSIEVAMSISSFVKPPPKEEVAAEVEVTNSESGGAVPSLESVGSLLPPWVALFLLLRVLRSLLVGLGLAPGIQ